MEERRELIGEISRSRKLNYKEETEPIRYFSEQENLEIFEGFTIMMATSMFVGHFISIFQQLEMFTII